MHTCAKLKADRHRLISLHRKGTPKIPNTVQPHHSVDEVETVLKSIGRQTAHNLRDSAMMPTLYDTGIRAAKICGMHVKDPD